VLVIVEKGPYSNGRGGYWKVESFRITIRRHDFILSGVFDTLIDGFVSSRIC
jgi:hypothetical protein